MAFRMNLPIFKKPARLQVSNRSPSWTFGLPPFEKKDFSNISFIGAGSYAKVYKVVKENKTFVIKELHDNSSQECKLFQKEVQLLKSLSGHENIIQIHGFSVAKNSMLLDYMAFSFRKLGIDEDDAHNLKEFLNTLHRGDYVDSFCHFQYHFAKDVANGLQFLHEKGIAHRDLKPDNILVCNSHYQECPEREIQYWWSTSPVITKLTDFGESRSTLLQTRTLVQTSTSNLFRGSPCYMAPEAFLEIGNRATMCDMQKMDLWSFGMIMYSIINPDVSHPYALEIEYEKELSPKDALRQSMRSGHLPQESVKYAGLRNAVWIPLEDVYYMCAKFDANSRPDAGAVVNELMNKHVSMDSLLISQGSVSEAIDELFAKGMTCNEENPSETLNACSFLSLLIASKVLSTNETVPLADIAQDAILNFPREVNTERDHAKMYSADEAYSLLHSCNNIEAHELAVKVSCSEPLQISDAVAELVRHLYKLMEDHGHAPFASVYTCPPYVMTICKPYKGILSIVDTHQVPEKYGGTNTGAIITARNCKVAPTALCNWLFNRMKCVGAVKQELVVIKPSSHQHALGARLSDITTSYVDNGCNAEGLHSAGSILDYSQKVTSDPGNKMETDRVPTSKRVTETRMSSQPEFLQDASWTEVEGTTMKENIADEMKLNNETAHSSLQKYLTENTDSRKVETSYQYRRPSNCSKDPEPHRATEYMDLSSDSISSDSDFQPGLSACLNVESEDEAGDVKLSGDKSGERKNCAGDPSNRCTDAEHMDISSDSDLQSSVSASLYVGSENEADDIEMCENKIDEQENCTGEQRHYFCQNSLWHNDIEIPVYELHNKDVYPMRKVVDLLHEEQMHLNKLCKKRPLCVRQDAVFLIKLDTIHPGDLRADGNGTYRKELRHYRWVVTYKDGKPTRVNIGNICVKDYVLKKGEYFLYWNSYEIPEHGLRRQINWLVDFHGDIVHDVAFLQYTLPKNVTSVHFVPKQHGNGKRSQPFYGKLAHSTLEEVKSKGSVEKPSTVVRAFHAKDPLMLDACSQPSHKTVYNCRYKTKEQDPLQAILDFNEESAEKVLIGQHGQPGITLVIQTKSMKSRARFIENGTVLQVDTTYGNHGFYVTVVAMQDKALANESGSYPWVMFAVAFHEQRNASVHELIVHDIMNENSILKKKKVKPVIITDAETSIWKAWKPYGKLLRCCNHLQQNLKHYLLHDLHIPHQCTTKFLKPVFEPGGLIDCEDRQDFEYHLNHLKDDFDNLEKQALLLPPEQSSSKVSDWLKKRSKVISKRMLKSARRKAGFPDNERPYTNGVEAFNHRLKQVQEEQHSRCRKYTFLEYLTKVILVIEKDMDMFLTSAVIGQGHRLSPEYAYLNIDLGTWTAASSEAKSQYIEKIKNLTLKDAREKKPVKLNIVRSSAEEKQCEKLDIILPHEMITVALVKRNLASETIAIIMTGAEYLLNSENQVNRKPSTNKHTKQYMVCASSNNGLHTCTVNSHHVTCTCPGYKSKTTCKHSLAVAYKENMLRRHLEWLTKQPVGYNKTALLTKRNAGAGQKGGRQKTKPRTAKRSAPVNSGRISAYDTDYNASFSKCYHNNQPFVVIKKTDVRTERYKCWHCNVAFEDVVPGPPHNIVVWHRGAWEYKCNPPSEEKCASGKFTDYYYHPKRSCIRPRYPYYLSSMLKVNTGLILNKVQRDLLVKELGYIVDQ